MQSNLREKIIELFNYREFPFLFEIQELTYGTGEFFENLVTLQTKIYNLDAHLESNWTVDPEVMANCWDEIYLSLSQFGLNENQSYHYTSHIRKYEKHELDLRLGKFPTRFQKEYYYFYKSCDVKLLRKLIYDSAPTLRRETALADWRLFDLVTEINDDVSDIFEDCTTINGNGLLIELLFEGKINTVQAFSNFINGLKSRSLIRFEGKENRIKNLIHQRTIDAVRTTQSLMKDNIEIFLSQKPSVKLFNHIVTAP